MPVETFEYRNDAERAAIRQAIAWVAQMNDLALAAPAGQVLDHCEQHVVTAGRHLLQATLQQAVQTRIDQAEEKKGRRGTARAGAGGG